MKKALIIIDVQKYFLNKETQGVVNEIRNYLANKSSEYDKIYFTIFKNNPSAPLWKISRWHDCTNSPDTDICDELKQFATDENLFYKNIFSAFKVSEIQKEVNGNDIKEIHLCGFDTDCCVLATAYDLFDSGLKPVILEDLTYSTSKENFHNSAIKMIKRNIGFVQKS